MDKNIPEQFRTIEGIKEAVEELYTMNQSPKDNIDTLCDLVMDSCESLDACYNCILEYEADDYTEQTRDNAIQFLLGKELITKAQALELTLDYE